MVNPGAFSGSRKVFLTDEKGRYAEGMDGGFLQDALAVTYRRYFKRYPIDLLHEEEPTAEFLSAVDDQAADPEVLPPDESLSLEELAVEIAERAVRGKLIAARKLVSLHRVSYQRR